MPDDIIRYWFAPNSDIKIAYARPKLSSAAVPKIFPNCPRYLSKTVKKRKNPATRIEVPKKKICRNVQKPTENLEEPFDFDTTIFSQIYKKEVVLQLPEDWGVHIVKTENTGNDYIVYVNFKYSTYLNLPVQYKKIVLNTNLNIGFYYDEVCIEEKKCTTITEIQCEIDIFINKNICNRGPGINIYGNTTLPYASKDKILNVWRHKDCPIVLKENEICNKCLKLWDALRLKSYKLTSCKEKKTFLYYRM